MQRFYAPKKNFEGQTVKLDKDESRHLHDVLRLRIGDTVHVFDGKGGEYFCRIACRDKRGSVLEIVNEIEPPSPESSLKLTVAAAILKGERFDLIVQKSVELGVIRLIPLLTTRTEAKPKESGSKLQRWRKIAFEASKQCGRATLMQVDSPTIFEIFANSISGDEKVFFFAETQGEKFEAENKAKKITAVFGPTGGWDDSEIEIARENAFKMITFGGRILRAETAVIAIAAILQHRFGDMN